MSKNAPLANVNLVSRQAGGLRRVVHIILLLLLTAIAIGYVFYRQPVLDYYTASMFQPTAPVQALSVAGTYTPRAERMYYASQPRIETSQQFNQSCVNSEVNIAILGCYAQQKIYIYDVTDPRLEGIKAVTAAHEMLHAAYERLSPKQKQRVDTLVEAQAQLLVTDSAFKERLEFYQRTEPGQVNNELHSILATEVASLSPELETYYKQYFTDRRALTDLHSNYEAIFSSLKDQSVQLLQRINQLESSINDRTNGYNRQSEQLTRDIDSFNLRANNGDFASQAAFNQQRAILTNKIDVLEQLRTAVDDDITTYEAEVAKYNQLSVKTDQLNQSINSKLKTIPSV